MSSAHGGGEGEHEGGCSRSRGGGFEAKGGLAEAVPRFPGDEEVRRRSRDLPRRGRQEDLGAHQGQPASGRSSASSSLPLNLCLLLFVLHGVIVKLPIS